MLSLRKIILAVLAVCIAATQEPPSPPRNVTVTQTGTDFLKLKWDEPETPNGEIIDYKIIYTSGSNSNETITGSNQTNGTLNNLVPCTDYTVSVAASTIEGFGAPSPPVQAATNVTAPGTPTNVKVEKVPNESHSLIVSWTPPRAPGPLCPITNHRVSWALASSGAGIGYIHTEDSNLPINGLRPCTQYTVCVQAKSKVGGDGEEVCRNGTTDTETPSRPRNVKCKSGSSPSDSILVTWKPPFTFCDGTFFNVTYNGDVLWSDEEDIYTSESSEFYANFTSLIPWTFYDVCVVGVLPNEGVGKESCCTITTEEAAPGPPFSVFAKPVSSSSIIVDWEAPEEANGDIDSFLLKWGDGMSVVLNSTVRQEVINALSPNTYFDISLQAHNGAGYGEAKTTRAKTDKNVNVGGIVAGVVVGLLLVGAGVAAFLYRDRIRGFVSRKTRK